MFSLLNRLKVRLQFTGWLQYIPTAIIGLACLIVARIAWILDTIAVAYLFIVIGSLLFIVLIFDLITVKLGLHPRERLPQRNDDLGMFDLMRARRSCRSFQARKLRTADLNELMESVRLHSQEATIGTAPVRFEYVSERLTVWPVVGAHEFLVAIAPKEYDRLAVIDVGRSLQKIVIDATRMGLGTCWIGPGADHTSVIHHLGNRFNPKQDHIICVCAVGYKSWYLPLIVRFMNFQFHRRLPLSELFFADPSFKKPLDVETFPFNRFGRTYEVCQWSPSSFNGQTTRCVASMADNGSGKAGSNENGSHLARVDFYASTASRYYAAVALGIWCANWEMGCEALGIQGDFVVLPASERGVDAGKDYPQLPRYDVSWLLDENI